MTGAEQLVQKLRRALPLAAHGRPTFTAALKRSLACPDVMGRLTVTDIFYAGEENGLMSRVDVHGMIDQPIVVVAPVTQVAFNRRHPIARDIATYCKRRSQTAAPVAAMCSNDPARVDAIRRAFRPCPHGGRKIRGGT